MRIKWPAVPGLAFVVLSPTFPSDALAQEPEEEDPSWSWSEDRVLTAVEAVRAGQTLNPASWPGGSRVAVLLSFDVDNETIWLSNGDTNAGGLSQGEYGARVGLGRILDLLQEYDIPATFFGPALSFTLAPEQIEMIQAPGRHEIGVHGWIHERNAQLPREEEKRLLRAAVDRMTELTGSTPVGYRAPSWNFSASTLDLLLEMGFLYDSSLMADDRPYKSCRREPRPAWSSSPWIGSWTTRLSSTPSAIGTQARVTSPRYTRTNSMWPTGREPSSC